MINAGFVDQISYSSGAIGSKATMFYREIDKINPWLVDVLGRMVEYGA